MVWLRGGEVLRHDFSHAQIIVVDNRITLAALPAGSVQTCVTSPPYWGFRDYGKMTRLGLS